MRHTVQSSGRSAATLITTMLTCTLAIAGSVWLNTVTVDGAPKKTALVGSWLETVTFPPEAGRPPLKSLGTFHGDGTMVCSDQGAVTTSDQASVFTSCHGEWTHLYGDTFAYASIELVSDLSGNLVGYLKVHGQYTVAESGNEYAGTSSAQIVDPDGNVLFAADVANAGQRIRIE